MKKWLFNPFVYIAGARALLIGLAIMAVTTVAAYFGGMHFDGAIDAHLGMKTPFWYYIAEQLIAWGCVVLIFSISGFIVSKSKFRFIDIAGTVALARAPMLVTALIGMLPFFQNLKLGSPGNMLMLLGILMIIPVIWMIALLYNAFAVCLNIKGQKAITAFIISLLAAEILALVFNHFLVKFL